ncbi:MAG: amylo-alpha-1,6-glucosidase, partial [Candidatus Omnitrophica bacterium]|nr:amylo-alpha-1,6-glucosidase [Candidatus Omnitrophota bacterium]
DGRPYQLSLRHNPFQAYISGLTEGDYDLQFFWPETNKPEAVPYRLVISGCGEHQTVHWNWDAKDSGARIRVNDALFIEQAHLFYVTTKNRATGEMRSFPLTGGMQGLLRDAPLPREEDVAGLLQENRNLQIKRLSLIPDEAVRNNRFAQQLALNLWQFVARRDDFYTIIAGYPWFSDWGRDTFECFEAILEAGMFDVAQGLLAAFGRFERDGMLPNIITGETASNYDTVDAPLLYVLSVRDYIAATSDDTILNRDVGGRTVLQVVESIIQHYQSGTPNGIRMNPASKLIWSPSHFSWMDTNFPAATPRQGYNVDNCSNFARAVRFLGQIYRHHVRDEEAAQFYALADEITRSISQYFWVEERSGYLADNIWTENPDVHPSEGILDKAVRSNQDIAAGLLSQARQEKVVEIVRNKLLVPAGVRSLSEDSWSQPEFPYRPYYEGPENDSRQWPNRKLGYHNGTAWLHVYTDWIMAFIEAHGSSKEVLEMALAYFAPVAEHLREGGIGSVSEVRDGNYPHWLRGCSDQAWAVARTLAAFAKILKAYLRTQREKADAKAVSSDSNESLDNGGTFKPAFSRFDLSASGETDLTREEVDTIVERALANPHNRSKTYFDISAKEDFAKRFFFASPHANIYSRISALLENMRIEVHVLEGLIRLDATPLRGCWQIGAIGQSHLLKIYINAGHKESLGSIAIHEIAAAVTASFVDPDLGRVAPTSHETNLEIEDDFLSWKEYLRMPLFIRMRRGMLFGHTFSERALNEISGIVCGSIDFAAGKRRISEFSTLPEWLSSIGTHAIVEVLGENRRRMANTWQRGKYIPKFNDLISLAQGLGVDARDVIELRYRQEISSIQVNTPLADRFSTLALNMPEPLLLAALQALKIFEAQVMEQIKDEAFLEERTVTGYARTISASSRESKIKLYHSDLFAHSTAWLIPQETSLMYKEPFNFLAFVNRGNPADYLLVVYAAADKRAADKLILLGSAVDAPAHAVFLRIPRNQFINMKDLKQKDAGFFMDFAWRARKDFYGKGHNQDAFVEKYLPGSREFKYPIVEFPGIELLFPNIQVESMWSPLSEHLYLAGSKAHLHSSALRALVHVTRAPETGALQPYRTSDGRYDYLFFVPQPKETLVYSSLQQTPVKTMDTPQPKEPLVRLKGRVCRQYVSDVVEIHNFLLNILGRYARWSVTALIPYAHGIDRSMQTELELAKGASGKHTTFYFGKHFFGAAAFLTPKGHTATSRGVTIVKIFSGEVNQFTETGRFLDRAGAIIRDDVFIDAQGRWVNAQGGLLNISPLQPCLEIALFDKHFFYLKGISAQESLPLLRGSYLHLPLLQHLISSPDERPFGLDLKVTSELQDLGQPLPMLDSTGKEIRHHRSMGMFDVYPNRKNVFYFDQERQLWQKYPLTYIIQGRQNFISQEPQLILHLTQLPVDDQVPSAEQENGPFDNGGQRNESAAFYAQVRLCIVGQTKISEEIVSQITNSQLRALVSIALSGESAAIEENVIPIMRMIKALGLAEQNIREIMLALSFHLPRIIADTLTDLILDSEAEIAKLFAANSWSSRREKYGVGESRELTRLAIARTINFVLAHYCDETTRLILDVGAGEGFLETLLDINMLRPAEVIPFDINPHFLLRLQEKGLTKRTVAGDVYSLYQRLQEEGIGEVDAIIALDSFDTFENLPGAMQQCFAALRRGGKALIFQVLRADPRPNIKAARAAGAVYCPKIDAFFSDAQAAKTVMYPYFVAEIRGRSADPTEDFYAWYTKLRMQLELNITTDVYFPRLVAATKDAGFTVLYAAGQKSNILTSRSSRHDQAKTDDGLMSIPQDVNMLDSSYGQTMLAKVPNLPEGKIIEQAEVMIMVAEKPSLEGSFDNGGQRKKDPLKGLTISLYTVDDYSEENRAQEEKMVAWLTKNGAFVRSIGKRERLPAFATFERFCLSEQHLAVNTQYGERSLVEKLVEKDILRPRGVNTQGILEWDWVVREINEDTLRKIGFFDFEIDWIFRMWYATNTLHALERYLAPLKDSRLTTVALTGGDPGACLAVVIYHLIAYYKKGHKIRLIYNHGAMKGSRALGLFRAKEVQESHLKWAHVPHWAFIDGAMTSNGISLEDVGIVFEYYTSTDSFKSNFLTIHDQLLQYQRPDYSPAKSRGSFDNGGKNKSGKSGQGRLWKNIVIPNVTGNAQMPKVTLRLLLSTYTFTEEDDPVMAIAGYTVVHGKFDVRRGIRLNVNARKEVAIQDYFPVGHGAIISDGWQKYHGLGISQTTLFWIARFALAIGSQKIIVRTGSLHNAHVFKKYFAQYLVVDGKTYASDDPMIFDERVLKVLLVTDPDTLEMIEYVSLSHIADNQYCIVSDGEAFKRGKRITIDKCFIYDSHKRCLGLISCGGASNAHMANLTFYGNPMIPAAVEEKRALEIIPQEFIQTADRMSAEFFAASAGVSQDFEEALDNGGELAGHQGGIVRSNNHETDRALSTRYQRAQEMLRLYQQGYLLENWEHLGDDERGRLLSDIERADWNEAMALFDNLVVKSKKLFIPVDSFNHIAPIIEQRAEAGRAGEETLRWGAHENKTRFAGILVAGGTGSSLKFTHAKGMLPATLLSGRTLYLALINKMRAAARSFGHAKMYPKESYDNGGLNTNIADSDLTAKAQDFGTSRRLLASFSLQDPEVHAWEYVLKEGFKVGTAELPRVTEDFLLLAEHVLRHEEGFLEETFKNIFDRDIDRSQIDSIQINYSGEGGLKHAFLIVVRLKDGRIFDFSLRLTKPTIDAADRNNIICSMYPWKTLKKGAHRRVARYGSCRRVYQQKFDYEIAAISQEYVYGPTLAEILRYPSVPLALRAQALVDAVLCYLEALEEYGIGINDPKPENISLLRGTQKEWKVIDLDKIVFGPESSLQSIRTREEYIEILKFYYADWWDYLWPYLDSDFKPGVLAQESRAGGDYLSRERFTSVLEEIDLWRPAVNFLGAPSAQSQEYIIAQKLACFCVLNNIAARVASTGTLLNGFIECFHNHPRKDLLQALVWYPGDVPIVTDDFH